MQAHGFVTTHVLRGYYSYGGELHDALHMRASLLASAPAGGGGGSCCWTTWLCCCCARWVRRPHADAAAAKRNEELTEADALV